MIAPRSAPTSSLPPQRALPHLGLQLYTLRDLAQRDLPDALRAVADLGYAGVEFAGLFDHDPADLRALLDRLGLRAVSTMIDLARLHDNLPDSVAEASTLGCSTIVIPYLPESQRTPEGYRAAISDMEHFARELAAAHLRLAYHHHAFEFDLFAPASMPARGIDLLQACPIPLEVDVYWAAFGGADPVAFLHANLARTRLVHLKDMTPPPQRAFTEIGRGTLDFPAILDLALARESAVEWLFVEQDANFARSSLDSARASLTTLQSLYTQAQERARHA